MKQTWLIELAHPETPDESALRAIDGAVQAASDDRAVAEQVNTDWVGVEPITATVILVSVGTGIVGSGLVALVQGWVSEGRVKRANRQVLQAIALDHAHEQGIVDPMVDEVRADEGFTRFLISDRKRVVRSICIADNGHLLANTD